MKQFTSFNQAFKWVDDVVKKSVEKALPKVTKQYYKDSKEFTYIDTQTMYDSGETRSDFKKGLILIKAPQVRWLYYTSGINAGPGNRSAVPQWFERTKIENKAKYLKMIAEIINQQKKE